MPPEIEHYLNNPYITQAYSYKDFQKGEPAIYCNVSPCTASSTLIKSRDNLDTPEPNAPNTIDGCEDGTYGSYLSSESIESITVTSLNNSFFKIGDTINIEIEVYCDTTSDKLNIVYSNDIEDIIWRVIDNAQCSSTGIQTITRSFNLDSNIGQHAIRSIFGFNLDDSKICGDDYYDDNEYCQSCISLPIHHPLVIESYIKSYFLQFSYEINRRTSSNRRSDDEI